MFGKAQNLVNEARERGDESRFNPRVRGTCLVSCLGRPRGAYQARSQRDVSIPVCGEHVW